MGRHERSIKIAFDKLSGEILEADEIFDDKKEGFSVRRQFHTDEVELFCCECQQRLNVSTSKYDRLHFKHQPHAEYCILKDEKLTPAEQDQITRILIAKESDRHKELKNKIGDRLRTTNGVDASSIAIDNKFIIRGDQKRRPDVFCKYRDKDLVFEIQLADLSLRYILSRYNFYRTHGMYLIWILDNFDVRNQGQLERDIKYLAKYQNFFKLDETVEEFRLHCEYKFPFLTVENKLQSKWIQKSVSLDQLSFDSEAYQAYYYNFGDSVTRLEENQKRIDVERRQAEEQKAAQRRLEIARSKAQEIIEEIKERRRIKSPIFDRALNLVSKLDDFEVEVLNTSLNLPVLTANNKPVLLHWMETASADDSPFIRFILNCREFDLDVNRKGIDGTTAFQALYQNSKLLDKHTPTIALFKRGYNLSQEDKEFHFSQPGTEAGHKIMWDTFQFYDRLADRQLIDEIIKSNFLGVLYTIESARQNTIVGYRFSPNAWVALANNAIEYYSFYWEYIELAFKFYGIWDTLIQLDKKGTFQQKLQAFYLKMPPQKYDFDDVFRDLFPEVASW